MWVLLGGIVTGFNLTWIPDWVQGLFQPDGTTAVFAVVSAIVALLQFTPLRKNKAEASEAPQKMVASHDPKEKIAYTLIPFWPARSND